MCDCSLRNSRVELGFLVYTNSENAYDPGVNLLGLSSPGAIP